jgi:hypothetical protein
LIDDLDEYAECLQDILKAPKAVAFLLTPSSGKRLAQFEVNLHHVADPSKACDALPPRPVKNIAYDQMIPPSWLPYLNQAGCMCISDPRHKAQYFCSRTGADACATPLWRTGNHARIAGLQF